ncbi:MAG: methylmalonyl-CoA mutase family protein [Gammaproteobacteria bacterium]|nr:methylmalonyl-CoA mutase family protein [Gammaproteobacteria bacterium]
MSHAASSKTVTLPKPAKRAYKIRLVTAASLFDGHDASINVMRRILQSSGAEVIHLGHNRSVEDIVTAALHEDVQGVAVSSYQGGHVEYFKYMVDMLRQRSGEHIKVFGGGGGVIVPAEIRELEQYGVTRVYSPDDGQRMGLQGMIDDMLQYCDFDPSAGVDIDLDSLSREGWRGLAHLITTIENGALGAALKNQLADKAGRLPKAVPILGITGTGGSGKSSLTDELVMRFRLDYGERLKVAIVAVDPSRRKSGGALLGDRIRMNAIGAPNVFMRSLATRDAAGQLPGSLTEMVAAMKLSGFDLIIVETPGIGQGDAGIVPHVDLSLYVMTPEFGAGSQLEKIDMLDYADIVAINKFDRRGAQDALRDVRKQVQRNSGAFDATPEDMPVYGTIASHFNDNGVTALYQDLCGRLQQLGLPPGDGRLPRVDAKTTSGQHAIVPPARHRYLAEIADTVRAYRTKAEQQVRIARERQQLSEAKRMLEQAGEDATNLDKLITEKDQALEPKAQKLLDAWPKVRESYLGEEHVVKVQGQEARTNLTTTSLSGTRIPKVALPRYEDHGELLRWLLLENLPGTFPYTAGVFPFKRQSEDPTRMFAGEGDPFRTNRRFKYLSEHSQAKRLSTAFDSVTLYGSDPDERPDIYGKVGNSGVSIATLDDMKVLYDGFDLCDPSTSVSMTINGPAPTILAMFLNTAIDQQLAKFERDNGRAPTEQDLAKITSWSLENVRGTVQADILKEDQGQNTCIFSTEFSLKVMGDIQEYFVQHNVRNFYSVSISGYHIAEAGANPITQLALTLANGFTYVEAYLARGMDVNDFAPNLSFFFSNGMDPEYTVIGRVARRIWATAMKFKYGADKRSQKLKYHIQTSGRSLHAQEIDFNDIRTTLQALVAIYDNCNSLHTNAHDEAITTPTEESVRRAVAIQLIINREWGLAKCENSNQGAFVIDELTDLVEEAVLQEFECIAERGGVLGAMETGYQRAKIQEESLYYERRKHDGSLPIIGVNTFENPNPTEDVTMELARSSAGEKQSQLHRVNEFNNRYRGQTEAALHKLQQAAINNENVFAALMDAVHCCSLGQITQALFEVGGRYRRNM